MDSYRFPDPETLGEAIAQRIVDRLRARPASVLALASGKTPVPVYDALVRRYRAGEVSFAQATVFALDEYLGVAPDDPLSFAGFFRQHLFSRVDLAPERCFVPDGSAGDPDLECRSYEARILAAGGIDLSVLGIGPNGHIAMNEPGPVLFPATHVEELSRQTRELLPAALSHVRAGLTMGMATLLNAAEVMLLATGAAKAEIVSRAVLPVLDPMVPASFVKLHPRALLAVDAAAGSSLVG